MFHEALGRIMFAQAPQVVSEVMYLIYWYDSWDQLAGGEMHTGIMKECDLVLNDIDKRMYRVQIQHRQH